MTSPTKNVNPKLLNFFNTNLEDILHL